MHTSAFRMEVSSFELTLNYELRKFMCCTHSKVLLRFHARHINKGPTTLTVASRCPVYIPEERCFSILHSHKNLRVTETIISFLD